MMKAFFRLLTELYSRKAISRVTGAFAQSPFSRKLIPRFASLYGIPLQDAEKPWTEYRSLNDFFTRRLKADLRPIDTAPQIVVSPVDATLTGLGPISKGLILNVKGQDYTIDEMLNFSPRAVSYKNGFYFVLYLSPTDYHRIHAPVEGDIIEKEHIPGKVYPVNEFGLRQMRRVLSRNERLITYMQHADGEVAVIKVGAMNVSSIQYVSPLAQRPGRGDELAYFQFGSTVVLLMETDTFESRSDLQVGSKVMMGQKLGSIKRKS